MGYSIRCWDYRFTLWLGFDPNTFQVGPVLGEGHLLLLLHQQPHPDAHCSLPVPFPVQVNLTDVHAGELYMEASDPGEDSNTYWGPDHKLVLSKMAGLPAVSPAQAPPTTALGPITVTLLRLAMHPNLGGA